MEMIRDGKLVSLTDGYYPQIQSGLDANKPTSPGVLDVYIATDTGKNYTCYSTGIWTLTDSLSIEEYSNHLGTVDNMMSTIISGNGTATTDAVNHEMDLDAGDALTHLASYVANININPSTTAFIINIKINNIVAGSNVFMSRLGLFDSSDNKGVYFFQTMLGAWGAMTNDGITTESTTGLTIADGNLLTIKGDKTKTYFLVDGIIIATHTLILVNNNIAPMVHISVAFAGAVTTTRKISVDYFHWRKIT